MLSRIKQFLTVCLFFILLIINLIAIGGIRLTDSPQITLDPWEKYGIPLTIFLYTIRVLCLLPLPLVIVNLAGLLPMTLFKDKPTLKTSPLLGSLLCIRTVTRGDYPTLVTKNVDRNIQTCTELGLDNFVVEVVTDKAIHLKKDGHIREIIVPEEYKPKNGTLFKARALQYCLENGVNMLQDNDWIIHLDEETLLTKDSLTGIINFISDGKHSFGQGVITYANEEIVSWFTTMADTVRVAMDFGVLRFTLSQLHYPIFSWKGSFVVSNAGAELKLTFDHGPMGSLAEDCYLAMKAMREGYTFDFIEGEMWEKSTFNISDFMKQRQRWIRGIYNVLLCGEIPWRYKWGLGIIVLGWISMPFTNSNIVVAGFLPVPSVLLDYIMAFTGAGFIFMYFVGTMKSFNIKRVGVCKYVGLLIVPLVMIPVFASIETVCVIKALYLGLNKNMFYVVKKETNTTTNIV